MQVIVVKRDNLNYEVGVPVAVINMFLLLCPNIRDGNTSRIFVFYSFGLTNVCMCVIPAYII